MVFRIYHDQIQKYLEYPSDHKRITEKVKSPIQNYNLGKKYLTICTSLFEEHNVYLQQDGFLDKELVRVHLDKSQRPIKKMVLGPHFTFSLHQQARCFAMFFSLKIIFQKKS
jgi:hypothetical protein